MATKTFDELKQLAIQIRDEKTNKQNTASRVGTAMLEGINKLEQDYYDKTAADKELKKRDDKLIVLEGKLGFFESNTSAQAQQKETINPNNINISRGCRFIIKMNFRNSASDVTLKVGYSTAYPLYYNGERASVNNTWKDNTVLDVYFDGDNYYSTDYQGGGINGNIILPWNTDANTTRNSLDVILRKQGLKISYKNGDGHWINEQFTGTDVTSNYQWGLDSNWMKEVDRNEINNIILEQQKELSIVYNRLPMLLRPVSLPAEIGGMTPRMFGDFLIDFKLDGIPEDGYEYGINYVKANTGNNDQFDFYIGAYKHKDGTYTSIASWCKQNVEKGVQIYNLQVLSAANTITNVVVAVNWLAFGEDKISNNNTLTKEKGFIYDQEYIFNQDIGYISEQKKIEEIDASIQKNSEDIAELRGEIKEGNKVLGLNRAISDMNWTIGKKLNNSGEEEDNVNNCVSPVILLKGEIVQIKLSCAFDLFIFDENDELIKKVYRASTFENKLSRMIYNGKKANYIRLSAYSKTAPTSISTIGGCLQVQQVYNAKENVSIKKIDLLVRENLIDYTITDNIKLSTDSESLGNEISDETYQTTSFFSVKEKDILRIATSGSTQAILIEYNSDKAAISSKNISAGYTQNYTTPSGVSFVRVSVLKNTEDFAITKIETTLTRISEDKIFLFSPKSIYTKYFDDEVKDYDVLSVAMRTAQYGWNVYIHDKEFVVDYGIVIPFGVSVLMHPHTIIKASDTFGGTYQYVLTYDGGYDFRNTNVVLSDGSVDAHTNIYIGGGIIDGNAKSGCLDVQGFKHITISDLSVHNPKTIGLRIGGVHLGYEAIIRNIYAKTFIEGCVGNTAIEVGTTDNHLIDCIVVDCTTGFKLKAGANRLARCHVWGGPFGYINDKPNTEQLHPMLDNSIAFDIPSDANNFTDCYADSASIGVKLAGTRNTFSGMTFFNNYAKYGLDNTVYLQLENKDNVFIGCRMEINSAPSNIKIKNEGSHSYEKIACLGFE